MFGIKAYTLSHLRNYAAAKMFWERHIARAEASKSWVNAAGENAVPLATGGANRGYRAPHMVLRRELSSDSGKEYFIAELYSSAMIVYAPPEDNGDEVVTYLSSSGSRSSTTFRAAVYSPGARVSSGAYVGFVLGGAGRGRFEENMPHTEVAAQYRIKAGTGTIDLSRSLVPRLYTRRLSAAQKLANATLGRKAAEVVLFARLGFSPASASLSGVTPWGILSTTKRAFMDYAQGTMPPAETLAEAVKCAQRQLAYLLSSSPVDAPYTLDDAAKELKKTLMSTVHIDTKQGAMRVDRSKEYYAGEKISGLCVGTGFVFPTSLMWGAEED